MLKIDNLSNEIDATAVHGGQDNTLFAATGGLTVNSYAPGSFLNLTNAINVPTIAAVQVNIDATTIANAINNTAVGVANGYAVA